jgi:hypothetical protein
MFHACSSSNHIVCAPMLSAATIAITTKTATTTPRSGAAIVAAPWSRVGAGAPTVVGNARGEVDVAVTPG